MLFILHLDGKTIWDRPHNIQVNNSTDRGEKGSVDVFRRLFHQKYFASWFITGIYKLGNIGESAV